MEHEPTHSEPVLWANAVKENGALKLAIRTSVIAHKAVLLYDGKKYGAVSNICEPLDLQTAVFTLAATTLSGTLNLSFFNAEGEAISCSIDANAIEYFDRKSLIKAYDNRLKKQNATSCELSEGVSYTIANYKNKSGAPVKVFTFECKKGYARFEVGTAYDGFAKHTEVQTVGEQACESEKNGKTVLGATNADFFDIHRDNGPSGLCVKAGVAVANPYSCRNFFGVTLGGEPIISSLCTSPLLLGQLYSAVGGREIFLKNGKIADFSPLEPFGYIAHPRTCVGIKENGDVIVMIVDGRIPDYSNGASIVDLARLLQGMGAREAINLDGGGSSTFLVKENGAFVIKNRPADLFKPNDLLIRPLFNSLQIVKP